MRRDDDVGIGEQRALGHRLAAEDVERRAADLAGVQRGLQVLVDDQRPARDVQDPHAVLHLRERLRVQPALGLRRLRQVDREEVRRRVDLLGARGLLHAERAVAVGADVRVVREHLHPEALRALGDELADPAEPQDAERLVHELDAGVLRAVPAPGDERRMGLRDVPGQREQQRHRVLGRGDDVRLRGVGDDDAALGRLGNVDVVDPDAGTADRLELLGVRERLGVELRRRADQDPGVAADPLEQLLAGPVEPGVDVEAGVAQQRDPRVADVLGDEHLRHAASPPVWCSTTQSMHAVSASTSDGSIAGKQATRSWLRPSLR